MDLFDDDQRLKINAFDWPTEFPEVFKHKNPGFDVVIGNPPYVRQAFLVQFKQYFQQKYSVYHGSADLYTYFIERAITLLRSNGYFSFIVANKWLRTSYGEPLRCWLTKYKILHVVDFGDLRVFQKATTYPCIIIIENNNATETLLSTKVENMNFLDLEKYVNNHSHSVSYQSLKPKRWSLVDNSSQDLLHKILSDSVALSDYIGNTIYRGVLSGFDQAFVIDGETKSKLISEDPKCANIIKPYLMGRDIHRFCISDCDRHLIFTRRGINIKSLSHP